MKTIAIFVSSLTGNTKKLADAVEEQLKRKKERYKVIVYDTRTVPDIILADYYLLFFWCRRSGLDDASKKLISLYKDTSFLAIGTLGHYPDSDYAMKVRKNIADYINQENQCIDIFLCQGAVSLEKTMRRRNLPKDAPHHLNDEAYQRHLDSQSHPDEKDLKNVVDFVKRYFS